MDDRKPRDATGFECAILGAIAGVVSFFVFLIWQRADDNNLSASEARQIIGGDAPSRFWCVDHPYLTGLIVFVIATVVLRLYFFMRRMEDRRR